MIYLQKQSWCEVKKQTVFPHQMFLTEHTKGRKSASLPANHKTLVIQHQRRSFFFIISALTFDFLLLFGLQTHALHFDCCYTDYYWGFTATMSVLVEYIYTLNVTKDIPDTEKKHFEYIYKCYKGWKHLITIFFKWYRWVIDPQTGQGGQECLTLWIFNHFSLIE